MVEFSYKYTVHLVTRFHTALALARRSFFVDFVLGILVCVRERDADGSASRLGPRGAEGPPRRARPAAAPRVATPGARLGAEKSTRGELSNSRFNFLFSADDNMNMLCYV